MNPAHTNQDNTPQNCPQTNLVGAFSQLRFSLPKQPSLVSSCDKTSQQNCFLDFIMECFHHTHEKFIPFCLLIFRKVKIKPSVFRALTICPIFCKCFSCLVCSAQLFIDIVGITVISFWMTHEGKKQGILLGLCGIRTQIQVIWLQILTTDNHAGFHVHPRLKYLFPKQTGRRPVSSSEDALGHAWSIHVEKWSVQEKGSRVEGWP